MAGKGELAVPLMENGVTLRQLKDLVSQEKATVANKHLRALVWVMAAVTIIALVANAGLVCAVVNLSSDGGLQAGAEEAFPMAAAMPVVHSGNRRLLQDAAPPPPPPTADDGGWGGAGAGGFHPQGR